MEIKPVHALGTLDNPSLPKKLLCFSLMLVMFLGMGLGLVACEASSLTLPTSGPPVNLNGREGTTITDRITLPSPYSKITFTYHGMHNFIVTAHYEDNDGLRRQNTLVNAIGNYRGTVFVASQEPVLFEIVSDDGIWEGTIEGLGKTKTTSWSGRGDWVSDFFDAPRDGEWMIAHNGASNFLVRTFCLGSSEKWVLNEIGAYSETISIEFEKNPCVWIVNADGGWRINLQK